MAEVSILNGYNIKDKKAVRYYNNVENMKNDLTLKNGMHVTTEGFYTEGDGGATNYIIVNDENLTVDNGSVHLLSNGLKAKLLIENETINFRQLGAKPSNEIDVKPYFDIFENTCIRDGIQYTLYIPQGDWYCSGKQFTYTLGLKIIGCAGNLKGRDNQSTTFHNYNENQDYLFKIANNNEPYSIPFENLMTGYTLDKLVFEGSYNNSAIIIAGLMYSQIGDLHFRFIRKGHCLNISTSWEITFDKMYFRQIPSLDSIIYFDNKYIVPSVHSNCSALVFNYLSVENFNPTFIETHPGAAFVHNEFNIIDVERSFSTGTNYSELPEGISEDDCEKMYLFKGFFSKTSINCINWNNTTQIYHDYNSQYIMMKAIFSDDIDPENNYFADHNFNILVNGLHCFGNGKSYIVSSHNSMRNSLLYIGTVCMQDQGEKIYEGEYGLLFRIGSMNATTLTEKWLNTLMDKQFITTKSTTQVAPLTLKNVDDSIDITGCVLIAKSTAPIFIPGVKNLKLKCKVIDPETGLQTSGQISLGYKANKTDSYSFDNNIIVSDTGLTEIDYNLSTINNPILITLREYTNKTLLIYAMEYKL